jgi:hypothetical protein
MVISLWEDTDAARYMTKDLDVNAVINDNENLTQRYAEMHRFRCIVMLANRACSHLLILKQLSLQIFWS